MLNPGPSHFVEAKQIVKYLAGTRDRKLTYTRCNDSSNGNVLMCYAHADHAGDPDSRRSVTGYVTITVKNDCEFKYEAKNSYELRIRV